MSRYTSQPTDADRALLREMLIGLGDDPDVPSIECAGAILSMVVEGLGDQVDVDSARLLALGKALTDQLHAQCEAGVLW
jgi:hypothetical protein